MADTAAVLEAVKTNDISALRDIISTDPTLAAARNDSGVSALMLALYNRRPELQEVLLDAGVELDVYEAAALGRRDRLDHWLARDPGLASSYSADGFTALHLAAFFGRAGAVETLLAQGAPVDASSRNAMRVAPIHSAAAAHSAEIVRLLLEAGADPSARQEGDYTALHAAALHGDAAMVRALLDRGADPDAKTADGRTARDLARGKPEVEGLLGV